LRILFILFVLLPIAEIFVLFQVGGLIGPMYTIGLILLTAFVGAGLLRNQGYSAVARAQAKMQKGAIPATEMVEGIFLAVGGALLLTPGFLTDAIGFCCLIPGLRQVLIARGLKAFGRPQVTTFHHQQFDGSDGNPAQAQRRPGEQGRGRVFEGEFDQEN